ncbi:MAG: NAD(P)-dependent oxidoreductase, partial [Candidatus Methanomethylophilaceae archaeon]
VEDTVRTAANIVDNFIPGEAYNLGGKQEWEKTIDQYARIILDAVGRDDSLVTWKDAEPFTTDVKTIDSSKAVKDLRHDPKIDPEEGIRRTVEWMKWYYRVE